MPGKLSHPLPPRLARQMAPFGGDIRLARQRRQLTMKIVAERAGISRVTLAKVERGDSAITMGVYAMVLFVLGLDKQFEELAINDPLGRKLQDIALGKRVRQSIQG